MLKMRPLEAKRFEQAMIALEEEYLGDKLSGMPGDTWKGDTMGKTTVSPIVVMSKSGSFKKSGGQPDSARSNTGRNNTGGKKEYTKKDRTYN
jgi:hypothetical protein